jgi:hypothetical protein
MFYLVNTGKNLQILELKYGPEVFFEIEGTEPELGRFFLPKDILDSAETYSELFDKHVEKLV